MCAGVEFRSPWSLFAALTGTDDEDPWAPDALVWPLLRTIDASLDEPWAATLARHVGHGVDGEEGDLRRGRRFAVARRLARIFAAYAVQRPGLVADWAADRDTDGCGRPVADDLAWQPELWRRLAERVDAPAPHDRHAATVDALRTDPGSFDLPTRLSLFGHTRLPTTEVALLDALGVHREVHLWLPHPSAALWDALSGRVDGPVPRADDESHLAVGHPLLATLGRDTRELQRTLATVSLIDEPVGAGPTRQPEGGDLLGWLQDDLRGNTMGERATRVLRPDDRSVQVHACHGSARQVDVLREVLLGLLDDNDDLEPRDMLVMCPDVETYAPLIAAGFGLGDLAGTSLEDGAGGSHPAHRLRVKLADRALDRTNPLLGVATRLLDLAGGRAGVGDVLDLAHLEPVRRRFGFRDDDLQTIAEWAREAGVRWGFDAEHRADFGLEGYVANTWQFGLDRLLAGVAMSEDAGAWLDRTLPLDDVGSGEVDLVGRLTELVERLREVTDRLVGTHPLEHWLAALHDGITAPDRGAGDRGVADRAGAARARPGRRGRGCRRRRAAAARRARAAHRPAGRASDPGQLPHRHAHGVHDGADAVGAAPGGRPARPRRRRLPAGRHRRRRRRAGPRPDDRRARPAQRGPAALPRRDPGRDRDAGRDLHRRQRVLRPAAAAGIAARRAPRRPRRHGDDVRGTAASPTRSPSATRCSPSTGAT